MGSTVAIIAGVYLLGALGVFGYAYVSLTAALETRNIELMLTVIVAVFWPLALCIWIWSLIKGK